ncbi:MAG TPA: thioredoxin family protein [Tepidisphaeraceae bacterium]|nr:thioredoxin family protein [Tepidisphaeraceae bacterium]
MNHEPKPSISPFVILGVCFLGFAAIYLWRGGWAGGGGGAEKVAWQTNLDAARAQAARDKKPLVVYFTASWCGPCQRMKGTTFADQTVADELAAKFIAVKIDTDAQPDVAGQFNVSGIPHIQILRADGTPGPAHVGFISATELIQWLRGSGVQ